ncbi:heme lyase CcmF/NrfE family subunit [Endozoicomonas sp. SM1973]|uniref:Heme lyase CcmF/NrfE family subunit n=1 Tax=Spartinivicinus marinus TaxID=2994442 RepID=A0A853HUL7_9GAMM|nr:heme lyase CcmF/NrfE family subunit [Spartinivicinus marinus]MCX4028957.1 heme lyase CcmF/NrfE family subunit [Spartinivicinus marinus]NYZ65460.1 heme lyase CcmF/NrfE family subunit [Spartinivicinus marinus]
MIPELGHLALIIALCLAVLLAVVPLMGSYCKDHIMMGLAKPLATGQLVFLALSFGCLAYAFLVDDFSVAYVAQNSNTLLPTPYKFSAVWGAHEGSFLLWCLIMACWTFAVALASNHLPERVTARVLAILGWCSVGFLLFLVITSNPFERLLPNTPADGRDLNPLLQDFGLIIHPPLLYVGYVGFSVVFAFAITALLEGRLDATWARWSRPWTAVAWAFLTVGIALGSWWAYYELGWGGWWFWDPVENASFMPWLVGTALMHSLAVTEKRGVFKSWTVFLAIFSFSLSLLGAFLVRSGVLTSVHSFASDPSRGVFILVLLLIVIGGSFTLYAFRAPAVASQQRFSWQSKEALLLLNNIFLSVATAMILIGTLYPLIAKALGDNSISIGKPYFDLMFSVFMAPLAICLGIGIWANWKQSKASFLWQQLRYIGLVSVILGVVFCFSYGDGWLLPAWLAVSLVAWICLASVKQLYYKTRNQSSFISGLRRLPRHYYGMWFAHIGFAVTIAGAVLTSFYSIERDIKLAPGDSVNLAGYQFLFKGIQEKQGPNYVAQQGQLVVTKDEQVVASLKPEKRRYPVQQNVMTEAAIDPGLFRDLYVALGEPLDESGAWAVRVHFKAFVRLIWLGALLMALGGVLAALDKRYRLRLTAKQTNSHVVKAEVVADGTA